MVMNLQDSSVLAALLVVGCVVSHFILRRTLRKAASEQQHATQRQMAELASALKTVEAQLDGLSQAPQLQAVEAPVIEVETASPAVMEAVHREEQAVTPELLAVMAAAAKAFLGKNVRVLSAKLLESPQDFVNPWSQQGRVFVQASHNLRSRS